MVVSIDVLKIVQNVKTFKFFTHLVNSKSNLGLSIFLNDFIELLGNSRLHLYLKLQ